MLVHPLSRGRCCDNEITPLKRTEVATRRLESGEWVAFRFRLKLLRGTGVAEITLAPPPGDRGPGPGEGGLSSSRVGGWLVDLELGGCLSWDHRPVQSFAPNWQEAGMFLVRNSSACPPLLFRRRQCSSGSQRRGQFFPVEADSRRTQGILLLPPKTTKAAWNTVSWAESC
jgi:hypothetical protein